jgi:hypothetical protein
VPTLPLSSSPLITALELVFAIARDVERLGRLLLKGEHVPRNRDALVSKKKIKIK